MRPMICPVDAARLYDDLRSFIRANDQQGVRRAFGELNRAGRPITEVLAVVRSLSRPGERQQAQGVCSPPDDSASYAPGLAVGALDVHDQVPTRVPPASSVESSLNNTAAALRSVLDERPGNNPETAGAQSIPHLISQFADDQRARSELVFAGWDALGAVGDAEPESESLVSL